MSPEVPAFLEEVVNSLLTLEVLLFYTSNPSAVDTAGGVTAPEVVRRSGHRGSLSRDFVRECHRWKPRHPLILYGYAAACSFPLRLDNFSSLVRGELP